MKTVCVIGLGQFGEHLAISLSKHGAHVIAIDNDQEKVNKIADSVAHAYVADAKDKEVLETLIPKDVDACVVSLGEEIEPSILCTLHLTNIGINRIIVKAISDDHASILKAIGAHEVVFPERDMAEKTARNLIERNMADLLSLTEEYSIKDIDPLNEFIGKSLIELDLRNRYKIYVIALKDKHNQEDITILPYGDTKIQPNHILTVIGKDEDINNIISKKSEERTP